MPTETNTTQDGFLSRWSKRKLSAENTEEESSSEPATETVTEERAAELEQNRLAAEAVDLDAIDKDFDFTVFFKAGVPKALKHRALQVLWKSDPVFANLDGLVDYGENFADPALNMKTFQSAYEVGKGYLKKLEKLAKLEEQEATESKDNKVSETQTEQDPIEDLENVEGSHTISQTDELNTATSQIDLEPEKSSSVQTHRVSLKRRLELDS